MVRLIKDLFYRLRFLLVINVILVCKISSEEPKLRFATFLDESGIRIEPHK